MGAKKRHEETTHYPGAHSSIKWKSDRTGIDNVFYQASSRLAEDDQNKNDKGILVPFRGLEVYTRRYIGAKKESLIEATETE